MKLSGVVFLFFLLMSVESNLVYLQKIFEILVIHGVIIFQV